jgi:hypothetical protein
MAIGAAMAVLLAGATHAADVPVVPKKLIVVDKLSAASKAKLVYVSKDQAAGITKGAGTDVAQIDVRFDVAYDGASVAGSFTLPAGASDGTSGWLVNKHTVAKYVNKDAPGGPTQAKVAVVKPGKLLKLVGKGLGDETFDILAAGAPGGSVRTRYCVTNGGDENCHCSEFTGCAYKLIAGDTGAKLVCKTGTGDATCSGSPGPGGFDPGDVLFLADDALAGRQNNTAGSTTAQEFLIDELEAIAAVGLDSGETGRDAFKQAFTNGTNILGVIAGTDPAKYVMVGAHYDHLGTSCTSIEVGDTICNGATDNAAGVAAVLAIGRAIAGQPTPPGRSVILAFWDREEDGLLGSAFYRNNPLVPLGDTTAYVNFDIQGSNLLPSLRGFSVAVGSETGGASLQSLVTAAVATESLGTRQLSYLFGQGRSDYVHLVNGGVPSVFFTDATNGCYHTSGDDVDVVDFDKLEQQSDIGLALTRALTEAVSPPPFVAPPPLGVTFADAVVINDAVDMAIGDLSLFSPAHQTTILDIQTDLNAIVAAGPGSFDSAAVTTLLLSAADLVNTILPSLDCDGFLAP